MRSSFVAWVSTFVATVAVAQGPEPRLGEFEISSVVTYGAWPRVASGVDGEFVVVWDQNFYRVVRGRRFAADGTSLGDNFQVNTYTTAYQLRPRVEIGATGEFVVVWQGGLFNNGQDGSLGGILRRRFAADGSPLTDELVVNSYTTDSQTSPAISMDPSGDIVVVWASAGSSGPDTDASIQGQRFLADGAPLGGEFQLNSHTPGGQAIPSIDHAPDGEFVVVWQSNGSPGDDNIGSSIVGRRFAANANPIGNDFQVNSYTFGNQLSPKVAVGPAGDFMVVWTNTAASVEGQRFRADGSPQGGQFQVNTYVSPQHRYPTIASSPHGEFMVTWSSGYPDVCCPGPDGSFFATAAQLFARDDGNLFDEGRLGDELVANTSTAQSQWRSGLTSAPDGVFTVVWQDFNKPIGQQFDTPIHADGFESGDTSAWSNSVP